MTSLHYCPMLKEFDIQDPVKLLLASIHILLDGYNWRPLRSEFDYAASYRRICAEIFPDETVSQ